MFQKSQISLHTWWVVCIPHTISLILKLFQAHCNDYPTISRIAMDVCAIPATSVPCERLFSAGAEVATDHGSCLGAENFEQLQILKHAWRDNMINSACLNSGTEEEYLDGF